MEMHINTGGEARNHLEHQIIHVAADFGHMGRINEKDISVLQSVEIINGQVLDFATLQAGDALDSIDQILPWVRLDAREVEQAV